MQRSEITGNNHLKRRAIFLPAVYIDVNEHLKKLRNNEINKCSL